MDAQLKAALDFANARGDHPFDSTYYFGSTGTVTGLIESIWGPLPSACNSAPPVNVLDWVDNCVNENGFVIERKAGVGGTYATLTTVGPGTTSYTDTTSVFGITYFYRVKAFNTFGDSTYSNEVSIS